jgi:hypothetical protein
MQMDHISKGANLARLSHVGGGQQKFAGNCVDAKLWVGNAGQQPRLLGSNAFIEENGKSPLFLVRRGLANNKGNLEMV